MKRNIKIFALFFTILLGTAATAASDPPTLYGKVSLLTSSGRMPLANASVTLSDRNTTKSTYTDSAGNFAFYNEVSKGNYVLQILLNNKIMRQQEGSSFIEKREVVIENIGTNLSEIIVKTE